MINANTVVYRILCLFLYKKIISAYKRATIYYDKDNMNFDKFKNNLVLCNHDLWPIDILLVPFFLHEILGLQVSIVTSRNYMDYYINKELFKNYNLIPIGNSVNKIIDELNSGRTVILFVNWLNKKSIYTNTTIKKIHQVTNCKLVLLTLDLSESIVKIHIRHPIIYNSLKYRYKNVIKSKNLKYNSDTEKYIKYSTGCKLYILKYLLGGNINIILTSSDIFNTFIDTCHNIGYLDRLKLKGTRKISYKTYTKLIIPNSLINKYLQFIKFNI